LEGIHSRTDFDLSNHEKYSHKKLKYFDSNTNESYIPFVVETSLGLDRMFLAVLSNALSNEDLKDGSSRVVLRLPYILSPTKVAILPLLKKDGLPEMAKHISEKFKTNFSTVYDEKDAIGRRYRRQDALGTPFCITIDHQSLTSNTFTLRDRDSMKQERLSIEKIEKKIHSKLSFKNWFKA